MLRPTLHYVRCALIADICSVLPLTLVSHDSSVDAFGDKHTHRWKAAPHVQLASSPGVGSHILSKSASVLPFTCIPDDLPSMNRPGADRLSGADSESTAGRKPVSECHDPCRDAFMQRRTA